MAFAEEQIRELGSKLLERHVRTRDQQGKTISYIEGWHAVAEANRIFGFDGWDRETISSDCVWQDARSAQKACAYAARVRIRVRAGDTIVYRDGSGVGHGTGATIGEAHERALKEAETDATKRALTTFGNLFGLALYDKEKAGMRRAPKKRPPPSLEPARLWVLSGANGEILSSCEDPRDFCRAFKEAICAASTDTVLNDLWERNKAVLETLRLAMPDLVTPKGRHYVDVLSQCYEHQVEQAKSIREQPSLPKEAMTEAQVEKATSQSSADKSELTIPTIKRIRDEEHRRFVASQPCLVCGRTPAHAHHLRFAQPRSLGSKVSDEWTVPLCFLHHRAIHDLGSEATFWTEKGIDALGEARKLWVLSHGNQSGAVFSSNAGSDPLAAMPAEANE